MPNCEMWPCTEPAAVDLVGLARGEVESGVIGRLCIEHHNELVRRFHLYRVAALSSPAPMPHDPEWAIPQAADPNRCAKCGHAGTSHQGGYMTTAICSLCEDNGKYHKFEGGYVG